MEAGRAQASLAKEERKRGRPSVLSTEAVLQAALDVSAADPLTPVSVKMVARHLNVTSMAIYKYFASRDELLQAMSARLLEGFCLDTEPDAEPAEQIASWLRAMRRHLLANKQLINLLSWDSGAISTAWQDHTGPLFEALRRSGLKADLLAQTALWIMLSGMAAIVYEVRNRLTEFSADAQGSPSLLPQAAEGHAAVSDFWQRSDHYDRLFDFVMRRIIQSLPNSGDWQELSEG